MRYFRRYCLQTLLIFFPLFLAGCGTLDQSPAPVIELTHEHVPDNGVHLVSRGETLYEIAWRYGMDFRDLAAMNQISSPYMIYAGQKLSLKAPIVRAIAKSKQAEQVEQPKQLEPKIVQQGWDWPVQGKIIKPFALNGVNMNKGIDIAGTLGTPVRAASSGKVVYSGAALRGYGQLLIIKHNDTYLSAYAHNHRLMVKEGEQVQKGQVIAEMGKSESDQVKLHFEIRKNGQPIDPQALLG